MAKTLKEFKNKMDGAPCELYEFAEEAEQIQDAPQISLAAKAYLIVKRIFEDALEYNEIEVG
jgi:hypothetical protein